MSDVRTDGFAHGERSWQHLPRIWPYLRRYKKLTGASGGLLFVGVALSLLEPWPFAFLVDSVLGDRQPSGRVSSMFDGNRRLLVVVAAVLGLAIALAANSLNVLSEYVSTKLESRLRLDFRRDLFERAQQLPLAYHDTHRAGYFAQNINTHTTALGRMVIDVPPLIESVLTLLGMFVIALLIDPVLAVLAMAVVPFIFYSTVFYSKAIEPRLIKTRDEEGLSLSVVHEAMSMVRVIMAFRRERHELDRFTKQAERAIGMRVDVTVRQTLFSLAVNVLTAAGSALVLGVGALHVLDGKLTVGELLVVIGYIAAVYRPLQTISFTMSAWQEHLVDFWLALELLDHEIDIADRPDAVDLVTEHDRVDGRVTFEHVDFSYATRSDTLRDVSFDAPAGSVIAIVGPTGAGKTTLTNLIPRFYEASAGRVMLDGHDVRDITLDSLRASIAIVLQEPMLFLASIRDNIRYGRLEATDDEVVAAARQANAHDFISSLPDGYDTRLGERGATLSGGEKQRICIARAFLKDAPILILDEPTSSVDSRTEGVILDALERLMVGRTTFIVAHRLSTIGRADTILVLDQGRLVEQGTHDELTAVEGGLYRQLWLAQTSARGRSTDTVTPAPAAPAASAPPVPVVTHTPFPAPAVAGRPKVVVLGMMSKMPVAGVVWQTAHYLLGLERLGFDAYYVEAHARTPSMLMRNDHDDSSALAAAFIERVMRRFGLEHRWAFHALHDDGRCLGMSAAELDRLYADAALIINLHGGTLPRPEHHRSGRLVYVESDPCQLQMELHAGDQHTIDFLEPHAAFFTFGENLGNADCRLPVPERFHFLPTRQPVLVDLWEARGIPAGPSFTTIANWRQAWRDIDLGGTTYTWSKHHEFEKVLDLPRRCDASFELALASVDDDDLARLGAHGWRVRPALEVSSDIDRYRAHIAGSLGEFTVAKDQNVRLRSGWFSDRSATYLAAGRPVVTQDTGFGCALPTGAGLLAFSTLDEAAEAVDAVMRDPRRHGRAAHDIAREHFDAERVLGDLVGHLGLPVHHRRPPRAGALPHDLDITPVSRRPLTLPPETTARVLARPVSAPIEPLVADTPSVSVVVVVHQHLACTRMCLESVLHAGPVDLELVVVDNASTDGTPAMLERLAAYDGRVRVVSNDANLGFAAGANAGTRVARGEHVVLLNNDTVVTPGWLEALVAHLADQTVGAVGPVTCRSGDHAEVPVSYRTYGELVDEAAERRVAHAGEATEVPMLTFFCVALRRSVLEAVGPLDERYGLGMFEDDDYAQRLRRSGLRMLCAEDVLVHHLGEASFGDLVPTGAHAQLFERNKALFESTWGVTWQPHRRREDATYSASVERARAIADAALPPDAHVLVISRGDPHLLDIGRSSAHFPQDDHGDWAGHNPATSDEVVEELQRQLDRGATHLLVPRSARWWLDHYDGMSAMLESATVVSDDDDCILFELAGAAS